jgi:hypothetical protein
MIGNPNEARLKIKTHRRLNAAQIARARILYANGKSIEDIAFAMCVASECVRAAVEKPPAKRRVVWTAELWARAQAMRAAGDAYRVIGEAIGMPQHQVVWRFYAERAREKKASQESTSNSEVLEERARRSAAMDRRSMTATFFGDPPPGYSALDQKRLRVVT